MTVDKISSVRQLPAVCCQLCLTMKKKSLSLDVEIDRLTNSIQNRLTNEVFDTEITRLTKGNEIKATEWIFDWERELRDKAREVYKLTTVNNPTIIQGLISIEDKKDHVFLHLVESANFNKGSNKVYLGIPGNLIAFACKVAFDRGAEGYVAFDSKTALIEHYKKTLGAKQFRGQRMYLDTAAATQLVAKYFQT